MEMYAAALRGTKTAVKFLESLAIHENANKVRTYLYIKIFSFEKGKRPES